MIALILRFVRYSRGNPYALFVTLLAIVLLI